MAISTFILVLSALATSAVILITWRVFSDPLGRLPTVGYLQSFRYLVSDKPFGERYNEVRKRLSLADRKILTIIMPWGTRIVTGTSTVLTKQIFDTKKFDKIDMSAKGESYVMKLIGKNIATATGEEWNHHRAVIRPAFARPLKMEIFVHETQKAMALLRQHANYTSSKSANKQVKGIEVYSLMQRLTLSVLGFGIFSFNFESLPSSLDKMESEMTEYATLTSGPYVEIYNSIMNNMMHPAYFIFPFLCHLPLPSVRENWKKVNKFSDLLRDIVETRKISFKKILDEGNSQDPKKMDLLDMMIEANMESDFTTENMMHNLFAMFLAGHDTTSNALACAAYNLAMNPDAQKRAREEVNGIFGTPTNFDEALLLGKDDTVTQAQLSRMQYLNAVIKESMRMFPGIAQGVMRVAKEDVHLNVPLGGTAEGAVREVVIPKGTSLWMDLWGIHHDPDNYDDAEKFIPDRWLNGATSSAEESDAHSSIWAPFGGGPRICIGMQFSLTEQRVFLMLLLRSFEILPSPITKPITLNSGTVLHPVNLELVFKPLF
ncbi:cytochrome P450 [Cladochytrium replicatum]|nr:cytochrome P450 [Cladochytrium replicatum]